MLMNTVTLLASCVIPKQVLLKYKRIAVLYSETMWHNSAVQWHVKWSARSQTLKRSLRSWVMQFRLAKCWSCPRYFKSGPKVKGHSLHFPSLLCPYANWFALSITKKTPRSGHMNSILFCICYFLSELLLSLYTLHVYGMRLFLLRAPSTLCLNSGHKNTSELLCTLRLYPSLTLVWEKKIEKSKNAGWKW